MRVDAVQTVSKRKVAQLKMTHAIETDQSISLGLTTQCAIGRNGQFEDKSCFVSNLLQWSKNGAGVARPHANQVDISPTTNGNHTSWDRDDKFARSTMEDKSETDDEIKRARKTLALAIDEGAVPVELPQSYAECCKLNDHFLGEGTFGEVYLGQDLHLRRLFAIKEIRNSVLVGFDERHLERVRRTFRTEMEVLKRLHHVNIAVLYGSFASPDKKGGVYLMFELAERGPLSQILTAELSRRQLTPQRRWKVAVGVARALSYMHVVHDISHRDVKSSNIVLTSDYTPKVIDCGLAKAMPDGASRKSAIQGSSFLVGSPGYTCQEYQSSNGKVLYDHRCDVFSFGIVLFELLTGKLQNQPDNFLFKYAMADGKPESDVVVGIWPEDLKSTLEQCARLSVTFFIKDRCAMEPVLRELEKHGEGMDAAPTTIPKVRGANLWRREMKSRGVRLEGMIFGLSSKLEQMQEENARFHRETQGMLIHMSKTLSSSITFLARLTSGEKNRCPSLVVLEHSAMKKKGFKPKQWVKDIFTEKMSLYFLCEHSMEIIHPGIRVRHPKEWVKKVAPALKATIAIMTVGKALAKVYSGLDIPLPEVDILASLDQIFSKSLDKDDSVDSVDSESVLEGTDVFGKEVMHAIQKGTVDTEPMPSVAVGKVQKLREAYRCVADCACENGNDQWRGQVTPVKSMSDDTILWVGNEYRNLPQYQTVQASLVGRNVSSSGMKNATTTVEERLEIGKKGKELAFDTEEDVESHQWNNGCDDDEDWYSLDDDYDDNRNANMKDSVAAAELGSLLLPSDIEDESSQGGLAREDNRNKDKRHKSPGWSFGASWKKLVLGLVPRSKSKLSGLVDDPITTATPSVHPSATVHHDLELCEEVSWNAGWKLVTSMPSSRRLFAAVALHEEAKIVVVGSSSVESISTRLIQDTQIHNHNSSASPPTRQWTAMPKMERPQWAFGAAIVTTRRFPSNTEISLSIDGVPSPPPNQRRHLVVAGGWSGDPTEDAKLCNLTTNEWMELPPLQLKRGGCAATSAYGSGVVRGDDEHHNDCGGRVYVVGGFGDRLRHDLVEWVDVDGFGDRVLHDSVEWLDVGAAAQQGSNWENVGWRCMPSKMKRARCFCAAVMVQSPDGGVDVGSKSNGGDGDASLWGVHLVALGGVARGEGVTSTVECFDFGRSQWYDLPPMTTGRSGCAAVAIGCCIYVVGGEDERQNSLETAESFDFRSHCWTRLSLEMSVPRWGCAAVMVTKNDNHDYKNDDDNKDDNDRHCIVVLGGWDRSTDTTHSSVEVLEIGRGAAPAMQSLPAASSLFLGPLN